MVGVLTRKSRAMSSVGTPRTSRRVSAAAPSRGREGCAQSRTSRSRSSTTSSPASAIVRWASSVSSASTASSGSARAPTDSVRSRSTMRRRAAVSSQAGGLVGYAVAWPGPGRGLEGVAEAVLGEVEAAVLRDEQGQQPAPLVAQGVLEGCGHAMSAWPDEWSTVGRTSIAPSAPASRPTTWSRSSRSSVSTM